MPDSALRKLMDSISKPDMARIQPVSLEAQTTYTSVEPSEGSEPPVSPLRQEMNRIKTLRDSPFAELSPYLQRFEDTPAHQIEFPVDRPIRSQEELMQDYFAMTGAERESFERYGKPSIEDEQQTWPVGIRDPGFQGQELRAAARAQVAIHQWEKEMDERMSEEQRTSMFYTYLEQEGGPKGPEEYVMVKRQQQAESVRPESQSAIEEAARALARAPYEMLRGVGGAVGAVGGVLESAGLEGAAKPLRSFSEGAQLEMSRPLTKEGVLASREALKPFNPGDLSWWSNKLVMLGTRLPMPLGGGIMGAAGVAGMEGGELYYAVLDETGDREKAGQVATAYMAVASITERLGAKALMSNKAFTSKFSRALYMGRYRGSTEVTQEMTKLLAEYLGTGHSENEISRIVDSAVTGVLTGGVTSFARPLRYAGGEGTRPPMPSDVDPIDVPRQGPGSTKMEVTTPRAVELSEATRSNPKRMRAKVNQILRHAIRDRGRVLEIQRQIAYDLFGAKRLSDVEDVDQLATIYDHARQYQPVGIPKVQDDPQTNASLDRLVKRMQEEHSLTNKEFQATLKDAGVSDRRFMSRSQAARFRRHLMGQEFLGQQATQLAAQRAKNPGLDMVLRDYENAAAIRRETSRAKGKKSFGKYRGIQSMRHWVAQLDDITGLPLRRAYDNLVSRRHEADYGKAEYLAELTRSDRKAKRILNRTGEDAERIRTAVDSGKFKGLTDPEKAVAQQIRKTFQDAEVDVRVKELHEWLMGGETPTNIKPAILDRAQRAYDAEGFSALFEVARSENFGTRKTYYPKFRGRERMSIMQEMSRYYDTVHAANMINPELNAFNILMERATKRSIYTHPTKPGVIGSPHTKARTDHGWGVSDSLKDPGQVARAVDTFNQSIRYAEQDTGLIGNVIQKGVGAYLRAYYTSQVPTVRNLHQVLAMDQNLSPKRATEILRKGLSDADSEWLSIYGRQDRGLRQYMMQSSTVTKVPGLKQYSNAANTAAKSYLWADHANRYQTVAFSLMRTREAMNAAPKGWKNSPSAIRKVIRSTGALARFDDVTVGRAVEELTVRGEDAFARYIALQHNLDVQGVYHVYERSPAEQQAGPVVRRLGAFPRMVAELHARPVMTIFSRKSSPAAKDQAAIVLARLLLTEWAANATFQKVTGLDRNPYDLPRMLQFTPVGLGADIIDRVYRTIGTIAGAFAERDLKLAGRSVDDIATRFAPFYKTVKQVYEALGGEKDVSKRARIKLTSVHKRLQHAVFGQQFEKAYEDIRNERPRRERPKRPERPKRLFVEE